MHPPWMGNHDNATAIIIVEVINNLKFYQHIISHQPMQLPASVVHVLMPEKKIHIKLPKRSPIQV